MTFDYDVGILGAGPGGYVAAIRAAQLGLRAAVIEKEKPGGVCLNMGCIPSKALIHHAALFSSSFELEGIGISVDRTAFDYSKVFEASRKVADTLSKGVAYLLKKNGVTVLQGEGTLLSSREIRVEGGPKINCRAIVIATGSRPRDIPGFAFDESVVLSSTGALMLRELPKRLLILGAGAIGVEFAHLMNRFGVEVHLVEMLDRILPLEDHEITGLLSRSFVKRGIEVSTGTRALSMTRDAEGVEVTLEGSDGCRRNVKVDRILAVAGRTPNTGDIGLERLGIATERGFIPVGEYGMTGVDGVYAIGDVVATPLLAHVASREGEIAIERIAGGTPSPLDPSAIPGAVYCEPQIASFGLTESAAQRSGIPFEKASFPYRGAGKAVASGVPDGFVKILTGCGTHELIGAHIVGSQATELIHELLLAKTAGLPTNAIASMIHAHPTLSEAVMEAARASGGRAIHV